MIMTEESISSPSARNIGNIFSVKFEMEKWFYRKLVGMPPNNFKMFQHIILMPRFHCLPLCPIMFMPLLSCQHVETLRATSHPWNQIILKET